MASVWHVQHFCVLVAIMKQSTTKYARVTWTDTYEDKEYDELLRECYEKCKVPKEQGQKRNKWRCIYCEEVFQCRPGLNYHRLKVCPLKGRPLKQYPIVDEGERIVIKDGQAIVKGQLGKGKGRMASGEEDGTPPSIRDQMEVDNLHQFLRHRGTHQAPVMTTPNISNLLLEERGVSSSSERRPVCNLGVFEVTQTVDTTRLAVVSENHKHVQVEGDGEGHALEVEDEEWGWSPLFCLLRDFPKFRPPDFLERPWKHTREEFDVICKFLKDRKAHRTKPLRPPLIVLALKATWHFHFGNGSSIIEHYPKLVEKLEHVSQDKEFVNNLSRMQHLMREKSGWMTSYAEMLFLTIPDDLTDDEAPTLEDDVSSFNGTLASREHEEVVNRVLDSLIRITYYLMEDIGVPSSMWHLGQNYDKELTMNWWKGNCNYREQLYTGFTLEDLSQGEDYLLYL
jgi:hypothetical protein